jgi:glycerophosphodiester phosphodiesterase
MHEGYEDFGGPEWYDAEGMTPLLLSVANSHEKTTMRLLQGADREKKVTSKKVVPTVSALALAAMNATRNFEGEATNLLLEAGYDTTLQDRNGETALHAAARLGSWQCVLDLLAAQETGRTLDVVDTLGWTPLFAAAANGREKAAQDLLDAGADPDVLDEDGWSAKDHAAYRGHWGLADGIPSPDFKPQVSGRDGPVRTPRGSAPRISLPDSPIKETMIVLCLGSMDSRIITWPIELDLKDPSSKHFALLNQPMYLIVRATGASHNSVQVELPLLEDVTTDPIIFSTRGTRSIEVLFDLRAASTARPFSFGPLVGRGAATLSKENSISPVSVNLCNDFSAPILKVDTMDPIGRVNFNVQFVTPFYHHGMSAVSDPSWKIDPPMVIGHRGKYYLLELGSSDSVRSWEEQLGLEEIPPDGGEHNPSKEICIDPYRH